MNNTMKKILSTISAGLLLFALSSCDLTRDPDGRIEQGPLESFKEVTFLSDGLYSHLRTAEVPLNTSYSDYQTEYYYRTKWDGGQLLGITEWEESRMLTDDHITNYFAVYSVLNMQANYFIMRAQEALDNTVIAKAEEIQKTKTLIAEAKVMKALALYRLMLRFAKGPYNPATAAQEMGVFIMDGFSPLEKPARASKLDSYNHAIKLIDEAIALGLNEKEDAPYHINLDYAYALKARIYLQMREWQKAVDAVGKFIDKYPLVDTQKMKTTGEKVEALRSTYAKGSSENVVTLYADPKVGSFGQFYGWLSGSWQPVDEQNPDPTDLQEFIVPNAALSQWTVALYKDEDLRKIAYVGEYKILAQLPIHLLTKYMGDPALDIDKKHTSHRCPVNLFNIAEAYLIRAEAYLEMNDKSKGETDLETLMLSRGINEEFGSLENCKRILREERARELIGEGMRLNDMLRWGVDFKRSVPQDKIATYSPESLVNEIAVSDKRFTWEFPRNDRQANPNLHGKGNWD